MLPTSPRAAGRVEAVELDSRTDRYPDLARVRRTFRGADPALSQAVLEEREDRL